MALSPQISRRDFLQSVGASAAGLTFEMLAAQRKLIGESPHAPDDETITMGLHAAIDKSLNPAMRQRAYPGHLIEAGYGDDNTWPGLDSWEMAGHIYC